MTINKFMERKIEAEVLAELYEELERKLRNATQRYESVGKETEQARDWKTNELLWDDEEHTIPRYRDRYEYVDVPEDELTDEEKLRAKVIKNLMTKLEKL